MSCIVVTIKMRMYESDGQKSRIKETDCGEYKRRYTGNRVNYLVQESTIVQVKSNKFEKAKNLNIIISNFAGTVAKISIVAKCF